MKTASKMAFIVFLIGAVLLSACSKVRVSSAGPGTPFMTPLPQTKTIPVSAISNIPSPLPQSGTLAPGTYFLTKRQGLINDYQHIIFTVPAGWAITKGLVYKHLDEPGMVAFSIWHPDKVYDDPCHWKGSTQSEFGLGIDSIDVNSVTNGMPTTGGLANQAMRGQRPRAMTQVYLGGESAIRIDLSVPSELDISSCDRGELRSWTAHGLVGGANYHHVSGQLDAVYYVAIDRGGLVIDASHMPTSSEADLAELDAILASMIIDRSDMIDELKNKASGQNGEQAYLSTEPDGAAVVQGTLLDPEAYTYVNVDGQGFNIRFTVPAGWTWNGRYLSKGGFDQPNRADIFFIGGPVQVHADPCHWEGDARTVSTFRLTDGSMNQLMTSLFHQPMRSVTTPVIRNANGVSLAHRWAGKAIEVTTLDDFNVRGCYGGQYRVWGSEINFQSHVDPGQRDYVWLVDIPGVGSDNGQGVITDNQPGGLMIDVASFPSTPAEVIAEIEAILNSIVVGYWG